MKVIEEFKVKWWLHLLCFVFSLDIIYFMYDFLNLEIEELFLFVINHSISYNKIILKAYILYFIIIFIMALIHELIHGIAHLTLGGKFKIAIHKGFPCCVETSGKVLTSLEFIYVLLLPTIFFTALYIIFGGWLLGLVMALNLLGATGDLFMAFICLFRLNCFIKDSPTGFTIIHKL